MPHPRRATAAHDAARVVALLAASLLSGCGHLIAVSQAKPLVSIADFAALEESADASEGSGANRTAIDEHDALESLRRQLAAASWVAHASWSPEMSSESEWRFGDGPIVPRRWTTSALSHAAPSPFTPPPPSPASSTAVGSASQSAELRQRQADATMVRRLKVLARRRDEAGSAAAVALAYWSPRDGGTVLARLEKIVRRAEIAREQPASSKADVSDKETTRDLDDRSKDSSKRSDADMKKPQPKIIRTQPVAISFRCAAAEAWCIALAARSGDVEQSLAPAGRAAADESLTPAVRAELFRALAHWIEPSSIPGLNQAFEPRELADGSDAPTSVELRRGAIDACLIHAWMLRRSAEKSEFAGDTKTRDARSDAYRRAWEEAAERPIDFLGSTGDPGSSVLSTERDVARPPSSQTSDVGPAWDASMWPGAIHRARLDSSGAIRQVWGRWLAVANAPDAFARLKTQLRDADSHVREEACVSLGILGSAAAAVELRQCARKPDEKLRAAAARGLVAYGPTAVAGLAEDGSSRVRFAVAECLAAQRSVESAHLLRSLLEDEDAGVQRRAAQSLRSWPDRLATPLLLRGLENGSLKTREACGRDLARRTGTIDDFPIDGSPEERREAIQRLVAGHGLPTSLPIASRRPGDRARDGTSNDDSERVAEIGRVLAVLQAEPPDAPDARRARRAASRWNPADLPFVARALQELPEPLPVSLEAEILAPLHPAFASLSALDSRDVFARRQAARAIAATAVSRSLPGALVSKLADRLVHEQDQEVWRTLMTAVSSDGTPEAARLAELAAGQPWPDLRQLGCEFAARHGQPTFASWLLPLLRDAHHGVQLAAVRAAGACGNPVALDGVPVNAGGAALPGLRSLLGTDDTALRFAIVEAMSRLGDEQGMHELERLTFSESPEMRAAAARALGASGQARFVERLVALVSVESNPAARRAGLEALENLVPPEARPAQLGVATTEDGKIRAWRDGRPRRPSASP